MSSREHGEKFISDDELKSVLDRWLAPEPSKSLDQRVANSYHREMASAAARPALSPPSQKEVVKMKFCSTCKEEFADKFSFCPVDGTPLTELISEPEPKLKSGSFSEPVIAGAPVLAAAGSARFVPHGEYHLTMIDDAGLVGRLAKEMSDVAHEYQLTWPEFKRDPFGFTKRSLVGYGQVASKFFANRNVVISLIVAVVAMAAVVVITGILDRSQSTGTSRAGLIGFSVLAGAILITIFATWLRKNQGGAVLGAPESDANNAVFGVIAAFSVLLLVVGGGVFLNFWQQKRAAQEQASDELVVEQLIDIPSEQPTPDVGTAGLNKGKGGGSKPKQEKPGGGGGGGREDPKPASFGKTPQASLTVPQVVAPDPKPPTIKNPSLPVAATVVADPMLIPPDARVLPYGDFKSKSTDPSSGPGTGNGIGTGRGGGIGPGEGGGIGPGRGGNIGGGDYREGGGGPGGGGGGTDYNKIFSGKDVSSKARVLSKPEPQYTEDARKNQVTGTVVLRAVFTSGGQVTNIRAVSGLPYGLTERAIAAARNIKFVPATKDGRTVSMYIQLEYNFNLY
ncbi:MAG: energy transducer TonB [Pyrinomonadaceae bacterium]